MDFRNEKAKKLKQGAIRAMFDRAATMTDVISMGIGEPDMPTPELVCRAGAEALQQGLTHYTPNAGTMQLRRAIAERASVAPVGYDPAQEIIITNGGMGALSLLFLVILNDGFSVVVASRVSSPDSTSGRKKSCCALEKRCSSSSTRISMPLRERRRCCKPASGALRRR